MRATLLHYITLHYITLHIASYSVIRPRLRVPQMGSSSDWAQSYVIRQIFLQFDIINQIFPKFFISNILYGFQQRLEDPHIPICVDRNTVGFVCVHICKFSLTLRLRRNEPDGVSNHQGLDCLLNRLFKCKSKETSKLSATGLCEGNPPVTGGFPSQKASNAENVSIWWRNHESTRFENDLLVLCRFSGDEYQH